MIALNVTCNFFTKYIYLRSLSTLFQAFFHVLSIKVVEFIRDKNTKTTIHGFLVTALPTAMFLAIISAVFLQSFIHNINK